MTGAPCPCDTLLIYGQIIRNELIYLQFYFLIDVLKVISAERTNRGINPVGGPQLSEVSDGTNVSLQIDILINHNIDSINNNCFSLAGDQGMDIHIRGGQSWRNVGFEYLYANFTNLRFNIIL
jgi:hypothetical protein